MKYIAFLRAINVSGSKIIKMEDLRRIFAMPGIKNITTYIQSGNVLFEANETDEEKLTQKIEKQLYKSLSYDVEVLLRSIPDMQRIVKSNPFKNETLSKSLKQYVAFLRQEPENDAIKVLTGFNSELEKFKVIGKEAYVLCRKDTTEKLKFSNSFIEKKLAVVSTTRDWNTVNKILLL